MTGARGIDGNIYRDVVPESGIPVVDGINPVGPRGLDSLVDPNSTGVILSVVKSSRY